MEDAQPQARLLADSRTAHEANRIKVRGLVWFAAALVALTGVALGVMAVVMRGFCAEERELESLAPRDLRETRGEYPIAQNPGRPGGRAQGDESRRSRPAESVRMDRSQGRVLLIFRSTARSRSWRKRGCRLRKSGE